MYNDIINVRQNLEHSAQIFNSMLMPNLALISNFFSENETKRKWSTLSIKKRKHIVTEEIPAVEQEFEVCREEEIKGML